MRSFEANEATVGCLQAEIKRIQVEIDRTRDESAHRRGSKDLRVVTECVHAAC